MSADYEEYEDFEEEVGDDEPDLEMDEEIDFDERGFRTYPDFDEEEDY